MPKSITSKATFFQKNAFSPHYLIFAPCSLTQSATGYTVFVSVTDRLPAIKCRPQITQIKQRFVFCPICLISGRVSCCLIVGNWWPKVKCSGIMSKVWTRHAASIQNNHMHVKTCRLISAREKVPEPRLTGVNGHLNLRLPRRSNRRNYSV